MSERLYFIVIPLLRSTFDVVTSQIFPDNFMKGWNKREDI